MYQYEFFNKSHYPRHDKPTAPYDGTFLPMSSIEWIRSSYWAEHCLECAAPACFNNCENWVERYDGRCQKFLYGIHDNKRFRQFPYHAELTFRKWGKLETIVYPGSLTPQHHLEIDRRFKRRSRAIMRKMRLGKRFWPVEKSLHFDDSKYGYANNINTDTAIKTDVFVLQCYSYDSNDFALFLDITADTDLVFRQKISISTGYNQAIFKLTDPIDIFLHGGVLRAKLYPEDNYEANVVLLFCELVKLKDGTTVVFDNQAEPASTVKCVAWDLDNTIWDGILIESNPQELRLRPGVKELMQALDERGIIQCTLSKNTMSDVEPVLQDLGIAHLFVGHAINWEPKSANVRWLAKQLNIGLSSFAVIDDSPVERNEVSSFNPEVRTYPETSIPHILELPEFDVPVTLDGSKRREMYQLESRRQQYGAEFDGDNVDFLKSCNIAVELFHPSGDEELLRAYELVQRTNQLNLSGHKYEKTEFIDSVNANLSNTYAFSCADRFGTYGQVGYFVLSPSADAISVVEYAVSCRVAGKYLENALLSWLSSRFPDAARIVFSGTRTVKNELLVNTLIGIGCSDLSSEPDGLTLVFDTTKVPAHADVVHFTQREAE